MEKILEAILAVFPLGNDTLFLSFVRKSSFGQVNMRCFYYICSC